MELNVRDHPIRIGKECEIFILEHATSLSLIEWLMKALLEVVRIASQNFVEILSCLGEK